MGEGNVNGIMRSFMRDKYKLEPPKVDLIAAQH